MMDISINTLVVTTNYYKGTVDNVKFIYDPENALGLEKWAFLKEPPIDYEWENKAKKRIKDLVAATTKWSELEKEESNDSN